MQKFLLAFLILFSVARPSDCVVRKVLVRGPGDAETAKLFEPLENARCEAVDDFIRETVDDFAENGYPFARASYAIDSSKVLTVSFERGSSWVFAEALNADSSKSRPEIFHGLSGISAGSPVHLSDMEKAERRLVNSGYFESTGRPSLFRDSVRHRLYPVFYMRDLSVNSFEGTLSYMSGEDGGLSGNVELSLYNIRGTGRNLLLSGVSGDWERSLSGSYREPFLLGTGWNGIVRFDFDEDSLSRTALFEAGVSRNVGFFWEFSVLGGIGNDRLTYTLEADFKNLDRMVLPRHGQSFSGSFRVIRNRSDSSHAFTTNLHADGEVYTPVANRVVLHTSFFVGTLLPSNRHFHREDLFELGGVENLKGYRPGFFRTRAYGITELDLQWRILNATALHGFFLPGLHRAESPAHGWSDTYSYGVGISQYRNYWSFSLFYALHLGNDALDGLLHFGVKALF